MSVSTRGSSPEASSQDHEVNTLKENSDVNKPTGRTAVSSKTDHAGGPQETTRLVRPDSGLFDLKKNLIGGTD